MKTFSFWLSNEQQQKRSKTFWLK